MTDSDSDDWFNKDENQIECEIKALKEKKHKHMQEKYNACVEYIERIEVTSELGNPSTSSKAGEKTIGTGDLRNIVNSHPLDLFLYAITYKPDFFQQQIAPNDSLERVLLYLHILALIIGLELPGFHLEILEKIANNDILLNHLRIITIKLFRKKYKSLWLDGERVDEIINDFRILLLQIVNLLSNPKDDQDNILMQIWKEMENSDSPFVSQRASVIAFKEDLKDAINKVPNMTYLNFDTKDVYPTLTELLDENPITFDSNSDINQCNNITEYIRLQKYFLREDFMIPLRKCVNQLKESQSVPKFVLDKPVYNDVKIVLNTEFIDANRNEMIFIDVFGTNRENLNANQKKAIMHGISQFKTGALVCLTTSKELDNLILAKVTYTDRDLQSNGYIGIEILRQYNIGNINNLSLLMFETPAFFEPYYNVYNYLNNCNVATFPMKHYIISNNTNVQRPCYLKDSDIYNFDSEQFKPIKKEYPKRLPLNKAQLSAYNRALTEELTLIQGPPGTGKTHLSTYILKTLMDNVSNPIILITYTNDSLDKLLLKLSACTDNIVRFGFDIKVKEIYKYNIRGAVDGGLVNPLLKRLYYVENLKYKNSFEKLQSLYHEFDGTEESYQSILQAHSILRSIGCKMDCIRCLFQYYTVRNKGIIAMTSTSGAKLNFLFRLLKSPVVVFEEAAEILESHVISCLTPFTQHVVMIGDHLQLQPYTNSYYHSCTNKLNVSLFERLAISNLKPAILYVQYRMRPIIADLINPIIYKTTIYNDSVVNGYPEVRNMYKNLYFYTHTEPEEKYDEGSSVGNPFEAEEIVKLAKHLIEVSKYSAQDIVILSPYVKQIELINKEIKNFTVLKSVRTSTVDSFQGLECNIVLLSLVRSFHKSKDQKNIGFLKEKNRICVALSRAKHGLYIIGNMSLLAACSSTWEAIQRKLEEYDTIGENFPYERK